MTAGPQDSGPAGTAEDDLSIVPGLGPVPSPRHEAPGRLDPALDPDRYDPARDDAPAATGPLDPAQDPDRYVPPGQGQTLPELLGEGAFEDKRDGYEWAVGLLGIVLFLALVSWFFSSVVSP